MLLLEHDIRWNSPRGVSTNCRDSRWDSPRCVSLSCRDNISNIRNSISNIRDSISQIGDSILTSAESVSKIGDSISRMGDTVSTTFWETSRGEFHLVTLNNRQISHIVSKRQHLPISQKCLYTTIGGESVRRHCLSIFWRHLKENSTYCMIG